MVFTVFNNGNKVAQTDDVVFIEFVKKKCIEYSSMLSVFKWCIFYEIQITFLAAWYLQIAHNCV